MCGSTVRAQCQLRLLQLYPEKCEGTGHVCPDHAVWDVLSVNPCGAVRLGGGGVFFGGVRGQKLM